MDKAEEQKKALIADRILAKLPAFSGKKEDWKRWSFKIMGHVEMTAPDLHAALVECPRFATPIEHRTLSPEQTLLDKAFHYLLTVLLEDSALDEIMGLSPGHGCE